MPDRQFVFAPFRLDLLNEHLWQDEQLVPLRPKLFALLRYLVEHAGRLVTREEVRTAVWPGTVVSESVLRGAIRELREVLGDDATAARFVETIAHRGYRFVAPLAAVHTGQAALRSAQPFAPQSMPRPQHSLLIGREAEFTRLQEWLDQAVHGTRQVVFVTGEPGMGKTTLVDSFLAYAARRGDLRMARGQCVEHYGPSEAYLPVLEAVGQLCRGPGGAQVIPLLSRYAPTWLAQMPGVLGEAEFEAVQRKAQGATQERMLRELAEALEALTAVTPVMLVLEDLHWSDYSTLDLLSLLAQRRGPARLVLLGTYRPAEVIVSGHPLKALKQELQGHGRCKELPLGFFTELEVAQYLATRFPQQHLPPALGRAVHQSTEGNPLFLVNVVDYWVSQAVLVETEGQWRLTAQVDGLAAGVPESLRQMIEKQIERLTPQERRLLEAASVAGIEFSPAAVAASLEEQTGQVEERCEGLAKREQFLQARETEILADGAMMGRYRFRHALYQQVLYERVAAVRRVRFHRRIGEWEERAYGVRVDEHAAELAVHFERGQDPPRAVHYLRQAARNVLRRSANREAISLLTTALVLLQSVPDTPERAQQELTLLITLGAPLSAVKGYAAPEVEQILARALELCRQMEKTPKLFFVLLRLAGFYMTRGELRTARELGEQCLTIAQREQDPRSLLWAHYLVGEILFWRGEFGPAQTHLEQGIALYTAQKNSFRTLRGVDDPGVSCLLITTLVLWVLGYPDQALQKNREALTLAHDLSNSLSLANVFHLAGLHHHLRREVQAMQEQAEALILLSTDQELPFRLAGGIVQLGWVLVEQGQEGEKGLAQIRQGLTAYHTTGAAIGEPWHLTLLAEAHRKVGQMHEGLTALAKASEIAAQSEQRFYEAELHRLKGEWFLHARQVKARQNKAKDTTPQSPLPHLHAEAEACFLKALEVSRKQQAKSLELRAAMSLARLWQRQGKKKQARSILADIYGWFTEGFDTRDLQEAKALLDQLQ
jgi:DNA-binding winged helix-turn-helix (wHTH) protein/predicted ATPase